MTPLLGILFDVAYLFLSLAYWIILVHVIMSWLISFQVLNTRQQIVAQIWYGLNRLLAPIYDPIRRRLPDLGSIDITPLVVLLIIIILRSSVLPRIAQAVF